MKILYITGDFPRKTHLYSGLFYDHLMKYLSEKFELLPIFSKGKFLKVWPITFIKSITAALKFKADVIIGININTCGIIATIIGLLLKKKVVLYARGSDICVFPEKSSFNKQFMSFIIRNADHIFTVGNDLKQRTIRLGAKAKNVSMTYPGVMLKNFNIKKSKKELKKEVGFPQDKKIIINIGGPNKLKGGWDLIAAFSKIKDKKAYFVMIGKGAGGAPYKQKIDNLGLKNVLMVDQVPHEEIPKFLKASDIFISASYSEGVPPVLFESMAAGLPVIFTDVGGVREIADKNNVLFIKPGDINGIKSAIEKLLGDIKLCKRMSRNNLVKIKNYDKAKVPEQISRIIENI